MQNLHACNFEGLAPYQIYAIRLIEAEYLNEKGSLAAQAHIERYGDKLLEEMAVLDAQSKRSAAEDHCVTMSVTEALSEAHKITENKYAF